MYGVQYPENLWNRSITFFPSFPRVNFSGLALDRGLNGGKISLLQWWLMFVTHPFKHWMVYAHPMLSSPIFLVFSALCATAEVQSTRLNLCLIVISRCLSSFILCWFVAVSHLEGLLAAMRTCTFIGGVILLVFVP